MKNIRPTTDPVIERIAMELANVKNLYTELFVLLLSTISEDPTSDPNSCPEGAIEQLTATAGDSLARLRDDVAQARGHQAMPESLDSEVVIFESQLRDGLTSMTRRIQARADQLRAYQDKVREQLRLVQRKRHGAKGYRPPTRPTGRYLGSEV